MSRDLSTGARLWQRSWKGGGERTRICRPRFCMRWYWYRRTRSWRAMRTRMTKYSAAYSTPTAAQSALMIVKSRGAAQRRRSPHSHDPSSFSTSSVAPANSEAMPQVVMPAGARGAVARGKRVGVGFSRGCAMLEHQVKCAVRTNAL